MKEKLKYLFILLFLSLSIFGQEKRLCEKDVSSMIKNHIQKNYPTASKIKYYKELDEGKIYTESEFKFKGDAYSLKFLNDTLVEEEIFISYNELPSKIQSSIKLVLDTLFVKYKVLELQDVNPKTNHSFYEINIKSYKGKEEGCFEISFDKSGMFIRYEEILIEPIPSQF